jgi:hypothetical protein
MQLIFEALFVGVLSAVIGFIISTAIMVASKNLKRYTFWPWVIISFFITGVLVHFICEYFGINKWYCKKGRACRESSVLA